MNKDLNTVTGYNHGTSHINLMLGKFAYELRPIEVHIKEDGSLDNKPSVCIVMTNDTGTAFVYGQLSLEMWNKGLKECGYSIDKIQFDGNLFEGGEKINHFFVPILNQLTKEEIIVLIDQLTQRVNG